MGRTVFDRALTAVVCVCTLSGAGRQARAAGDDVDAIVSHGVQLRKEGKDREALAEFQRAAQLSRTPRVAGQIGLAEMALGIWLAGEVHLQEALGHDGDPWVRKNRAALEKALATTSAHLGTVEVWGTPAGAEVIMNGQAVGTYPMAKGVRLNVGPVTVTVRAPGYEAATRTLQVFAEQLTRENVDLSASPAAVDLSAKRDLAIAPRSVAPVRPADDSIVKRDGVPPATVPSSESQPLFKKWWFWTIVGVALAGGAVAAVTLLGNRDQIPSCPMNVNCPAH
jgi:hypothetical protein